MAIEQNNLRQKITSVFFAFLLLSGCSFLGPVKSPPIKIYTLSLPAASSMPILAKNKPVLLVVPLTSSPGYDTSAMIYVQRPEVYQLNTFALSRWVAPPSNILQPLLVQTLQHAGCFAAVVSAPFVGAANFTLQAQLISLQQEFSSPSSATCDSVVHIVLGVTLIDNATHRVLGYRRLARSIPAQGNNPQSGVVAVNRALVSLLDELNRFVCAALTNNFSSPGACHVSS